MACIRKNAVDLVLSRLPFCRDCSDPDCGTHLKNYDEIVTAGGYRFDPKHPDKAGTTCGFLCHWVLWMCGVKNKNIVNWVDGTLDLTYEDGKNIIKLYNNVGKDPFVKILPPATNKLEAGFGPEPGD